MQSPILKAAVVVLVLQSVTLAQGGGTGEITFSPPRRGSVVQRIGGTARGDLVSLTEDTLVLRRSGQDFEIEMSQVRQIRSTDGDFDYTPSKETFAVLIGRASRIPGVVVKEGAAPIQSTAPQSTLQATIPMPADPVGDPPMATLPGDANSNPPPESAVSGDPEIVPEPGARFVTICQNCMKQVPNSIKQGDRCPHCNVIIWNQDMGTAIAQAANDGGPGAAVSKPAGFPSAREGFPEPNGNAQPASGTGTQIVQGGGDSLADIPLWMKVGCFVAMLIVAWLLLQRR